MRVEEVVPHKFWRNQTGHRASIYGAKPHGEGWEIATLGWTWRMSNGTIGLGRHPAATKEEAEAVMAEFNAKRAPNP